MSAPAGVKDLGPDLRLLDVGPARAYLVRTSAGVVLVDTGVVGSAGVVTAALDGWGRGRDALVAVLLTHWHADHTGSAAAIGAWPGVRVLAHRADAGVIRGEVPGPDPVLTGAEEALWAQITAAGLPDAPPARVDRELDDRDLLAELGVRVIGTPGHTDGSVAFHFVEQGVLCTGDIAGERDGAVVLGPFNTDRERARSSFRGLAGLGPSAVCFGHGRPLLGPDTARLDEAARAASVPDPLGG